MNEQLKNLKQHSHLIKQLYEFVKKHLCFQKDASIVFLVNEKNSNDPLGKTAYYSPDEQKVAVYINNRHIKDILRSISHELIHHHQHCRGAFNDVENTNEGYAQHDEHLREMEKEAYLVGNMLFRDWEDGIKTQKENKNG